MTTYQQKTRIDKNFEAEKGWNSW